MKIRASHSIKYFIIPLLIFSFFCVYNTAKASILSDFSSGITSVVSYVNNTFIKQIKNDFCSNYILSISSGEWGANEYRTKVGKKICTGYTVASSGEEVEKEDVINVNAKDYTVTTKVQVSTSTADSTTVLVVNTSEPGNTLTSGLVIYWTNTERGKQNLSSLTENSVLKKIAMIRVKDMFNQQYFEHNSPSGDNASKEAVSNDYTYITIGENIALGNFGSSRDLVQAWMNSPGHRANILNNNYTEIGVYAEKGMYKGESVWLAAQIFGKPLKGCAEPSAAMKTKINQYKVSAESIKVDIDRVEAEMKALGPSNSGYNAKVSEYNTLAKMYNDLVTEIKTLVAEYNKQVQVYNNCVKTS